MRKIISALALLMFTTPLWAKTLTPEEALQRVKQGQITPASVNRTQPRLLSTGYMDNSLPAYYVFETGDDAGYMVLAADDVARPMLGYSDTGTFNPDEMPDNLRYWLENYANEIAAASECDASGRYAITALTESASESQVRTAISPLCSTKWKQTDPYNNLTPEITDNGSSKQSVTGCVATAMAQLMKYYNYPTTGTGSNEYTWTKYNDYADTSGETTEVTLSMDFSEVTFDWENMLDTYSGTYTDEQATAVATLMKACGYAVSMNYGTSSGASVTSTLQALKTNFGYDDAAMLYCRDYYGIDAWTDLLYNNLKNIGPIFYAGSNDYGGHAFIVDGYDGSGYFHINWGWGGQSDGYFLITALDPSAQGTGGSLAGYNSGQHCILDAFPADKYTACNTPAFQLATTGATEASVSDDTLTLTDVFSNIGTDGTNVYVALEFCDYSDDTHISYAYYGRAASFPYNSYIESIKATIPTSLDAGTYKVYPVAADNNDTDNYERAVAPIGYANYVILTVADDGTYSVKSVDPATITVTDVTLGTNVYYGMPFHATATATNNNDTETLSEITPMFFSSAYEVIAYCETQIVNLRAGESISLSGDYKVIAASNAFAAGVECYFGYVEDNVYVVSDLVPVTIQAVPTSVSLECNSFHVTSANNKEITIDYVVSCTEGYYADNLTIVFFNESYSSVALADLPVLYLEAGYKIEAKDVQISTPSALEVGTSYYAALCYLINSNYEQLSNVVMFTVGNSTEIEEIAIADSSISAAINNDILTVTSASAVQSVTVYDISGKLIASSADCSVNLSGTSTGVYIVNVVTDSGTTSLKVVK